MSGNSSASTQLLHHSASHEALSRRCREGCPRCGRTASQEFSPLSARERCRGARHQARNRRRDTGADHQAIAETVSRARALRRGRNRGRPIKRPSMGGRSTRWHRKLFLPHSAFLRFDRASLERRDHCRCDLRSDARGNVEHAKGRKAATEWSTFSRERSHESGRSRRFSRTRQNGSLDRFKSAAARGDDSSGAQMSCARQRRARHGLRRVRPV